MTTDAASPATREAVLRRVALLASVGDAAIAQLAAASHLVTVDKGEILFVEGEPSDRMWVVLSGRVRIFRNSESGAELVLSHATPGESIGELSVIDELPRSASAQALERCRVISVPADRMREVLSASPGAMLAVARHLAVTVRRLTGTTSDFIFLDLPHRLAKYLLDLVGEPEGNGATVVLPASQSGIAAQLGVTRQSLNQALGALAQSGLIAVDGRTVRVPDRAALEEF
jgi:CRP-like cAMP-binding protein